MLIFLRSDAMTTTRMLKLTNAMLMLMLASLLSDADAVRAARYRSLTGEANKEMLDLKCMGQVRHSFLCSRSEFSSSALSLYTLG
jgi:hypothetical protein